MAAFMAACLASGYAGPYGVEVINAENRSRSLDELVTKAYTTTASMFPGDSRDIRDDVVQLHVHLHERLLHVLNVRGRIVDQPLTMAQVRAQPHDAVARTETPAQQPVLMELLQPLRIVHVRLPPGDVLDVARVDQQHLEPARFENLKDRNPVHAS
jgi:hypothetical protein